MKTLLILFLVFSAVAFAQQPEPSLDLKAAWATITDLARELAQEKLDYNKLLLEKKDLESQLEKLKEVKPEKQSDTGAGYRKAIEKGEVVREVPQP